jgi:hypothetical protein
MKSMLDEFMRAFAWFLNASWDAASATAIRLNEVESTELMSDWAQANWEVLVETPFREFIGFGDAYLDPYGEGADCNDASSRVWRPDAVPTYRVVCRSAEGTSMRDLLTGRSVDAAHGPVVFDHFATNSANGWHEQATPFDCVLCYQDDQEILLRLDEVIFLPTRINRAG